MCRSGVGRGAWPRRVSAEQIKINHGNYARTQLRPSEPRGSAGRYSTRTVTVRTVAVRTAAGGPLRADRRGRTAAGGPSRADRRGRTVAGGPSPSGPSPSGPLPCHAAAGPPLGETQSVMPEQIRRISTPPARPPFPMTMRRRTYRNVDGQRVEGTWRHAFTRNGNTYYLTDLVVYADGAIDCGDGGLIDLNGLREKLACGCVATTLPEGGQASAHHVASWKFSEPRTWIDPDMLAGEVERRLDLGDVHSSMITHMALDQSNAKDLELAVEAHIDRSGHRSLLCGAPLDARYSRPTSSTGQAPLPPEPDRLDLDSAPRTPAPAPPTPVPGSPRPHR
jgi:hypothetical protein